MKKGSLYSIVFMILITSFFTFILASVNKNTVNIIEENQINKNQRKILSAFDISNTAGLSIEDVNTLYDNHIKEEITRDYTRYIGYKDDKLIGYGFLMEGPGLWGNIKGVIALNQSLDIVLGIDFFSHAETPGLGGRIDEEWYKAQFRNIPLMDNMPFITYAPDQNGKAQAISGATITSKAVLDLINNEINDFKINVSRGE